MRTLIRRGWIVPLITVGVAALAHVIASNQHRSYTSDATVVVPSATEPQNGPSSSKKQPALSPTDATDLAKTYAAQIPENDRLAGFIATGLRTSASKVRDSLTADAGFGTNPGSETALVTISYDAPSAAKAEAGASLAVSGVTGPHPAATAIAPGSLELVRSPEKGTTSALGTTAITIGGTIVGFGLALLLLLTWERADRRIDRVEELAEEAQCPATRLRDLSGEARNALLRRWEVMGSDKSGELALMPVDDRTLHWLSPSQLWPLVPNAPDVGNGNGSGRQNGDPYRIPLDGGVVLTTPHSPADDPASQRTAMDADLAILVARRGAPAHQVRKATRSLKEMGASPGWALLLE